MKEQCVEIQGVKHEKVQKDFFNWYFRFYYWNSFISNIQIKLNDNNAVHRF